jgi:CheY-like chemotaxis protein
MRHIFPARVPILHRTAKWVVLEVRDSGHGMDEKTRSQIFEPFFTTKPPGKGTGLGLATAYGIVKQSGGHIHVDTAPDEGTRFEIYFSMVDGPALHAESLSSGQLPADGGGATILVTDDEAPLRQAIAEILRSSGYNVLEASTAAEALEAVREHRGELDVLLTDIVMPGLRGTELARRVAMTHPRLQVIYMSGYPGEFQDEPLPPNSTFLQKPFRFATLLEQLRLLRRKN